MVEGTLRLVSVLCAVHTAHLGTTFQVGVSVTDSQTPQSGSAARPKDSHFYKDPTVLNAHLTFCRSGSHAHTLAPI